MRGSLRKILLFAVGFLTITFAVIVVNQTLQLAEFADRIHPTAGAIVCIDMRFRLRRKILRS